VTTVQIVSIAFLLVMVVLILRGIRGHPRRGSEGVELDATGNAVGRGAERMSHNLDTVGGSESGGGD
jgi:hypothetical protein